MDDRSIIVNDSIKEELKSSLLDKIIADLESGKMDRVAKKDSANFILNNINLVKNYQDLIVFLENLKNKWPNFSDIYIIFKNRFYKEKEKVLINKLTSYIGKLN